MMAFSIDSTVPTLPTKRKRAQVSYAEVEDDVGDSAYESGPDDGFEDDDLPDGDTVYGSRKKPAKRNRRKANKRARLITPKTKKPTKPFPFMALPAELRDYIYELVLTDEDGLALVSKTRAYRRTIARGIILVDDTWHYSRNRRRIRTIDHVESEDGNISYNDLAPNLLAVSKQIHAEAVGYLYKQPIMLEDTMALHAFLAAIGPSNRRQITDLTVKQWGNGRGTHKAMNFASLTLLAGCTNLRALNLDCQIGWVRQPKNLARQIYRDGHCFLEEYGAANGRKDAAVEVLQLSEWYYDRNNYYYWQGSGNALPESAETFKNQFRTEMRKLLGA